MTNKEYKTIEKQLQALNIIKTKRVDVNVLFVNVIEDVYDINSYNYFYEKKEYQLTQEEFDLLKEALCDE